MFIWEKSGTYQQMNNKTQPGGAEMILSTVDFSCCRQKAPEPCLYSGTAFYLENKTNLMK